MGKISQFGYSVATVRELLSGVATVAVRGQLGAMMDRTVAQHIQALEEKLNLISAQIMQENDSYKRNHLESELRAVESALTHYRSAFEIENRLSTTSIS